MMTLGMAGAGMIAPWLGAQLKLLDPALPFALSSLALAAGAAAGGGRVGRRAESADAIEAAALRPCRRPVFVLLLAAALGYFQIFFASALRRPCLKRYGPGDLHFG